jgi:MoxR-like ATPase
LEILEESGTAAIADRDSRVAMVDTAQLVRRQMVDRRNHRPRICLGHNVVSGKDHRVLSGGQALIAVAKARAALDGRPEVDIADIKALAKPVLRHRIVLNYNAEAQGQTPETVIQKLIDNIPIHAEAPASHGRIESVLKA